MAGAKTKLRELAGSIAKDHGYDEDNIVVKPISSGGANYSSQLFSITLLHPGKDDLKLFCKVATMGENIRSMSETQIYEIEIIFYTKLLSKFKELEEKYSIAEKHRLILPKYYRGTIDYSEELMVLEDMTAKGFQTFNRFKCFDWNYASACIEVLANFHALNVAFQTEDPDQYAEFISKLKFTPAGASMDDFLNKSIATAVELTVEIYRTRVETFLQNGMKQRLFSKFFNPERKVLLIHGDFRPSNILEKVDEDGRHQIVLIDYQLIKPGNPVTDLVYFLICGSDEEFRSQHLHQFFNHYYKTFSQSLQRLGMDPDDVYKEEQFRNDVKEMLPFGLTLATFTLLFITVEEDSAPKPDGVDFGKFEMKPSEQFQIRFNALVRDYIKLGIL